MPIAPRPKTQGIRDRGVDHLAVGRKAPHPGCTPAPLRTGQAACPDIRLLGASSASLRSTTWIRVDADTRRGPAHPGQRLDKTGPRICPPLALAVEPIEQDAFGAAQVDSAWGRVIRNGVVAQVASHASARQPLTLFLHWAGYSGYYEDGLPKSRVRRSPGYVPVFEQLDAVWDPGVSVTRSS